MDAGKHARLIAFYLPQFHAIPENDTWWGKGFTEWTNVAQARPLFPGHYQPHVPADLGFYDLRFAEVRQAQADLARAHGVHAFCYYHYWFQGRRLLRRPLDEVLASGAPNFPFCLCWANESWTRTWDGLERDVLLEQRYSETDDREHGRWLIGVFKDRRYLRVDGKPLFLVYQAGGLPNAARTAAIWREEAHASGIGDIFLCAVESLRYDRVAPAAIGFDATVEFQPDWLMLPPATRMPEGTKVYDYGQVVDRMLEKPRPEHRQFRSVATGWDNTARRRRNAILLHGTTPERYQHWLERVLHGGQARRPGEELVFINAWNDWGEGAHLEPCQKWGRRYLEATLAAASGPQKADTPRWPRRASMVRRNHGRPVSVCMPAFNGVRYIGAAIRSVLEQTFEEFELLVIDDSSSDGTPDVVEAVRDERVRLVRNPFRLGLVGNWNRCLELSRGECVTVFHQDDLMAPDNLESKLRFLAEQMTVGLVHSNVVEIDAEGGLLSETWYYPPRSDDEGRHDGAAYFQRLVTGVNIVCAPSVVMRREVFERLGGFDPRLPFTADWEMWLRTALFYDVGYLMRPLVRYRRHNGMETVKFSSSQQLEQSHLAKMLAIEKHPDRVPDVEPLRRRISDEYLNRALAQARRDLQDGRHVAASEHLAVALRVCARMHDGGSAGGHEAAVREIFATLLDEGGPEHRREALGAAATRADQARARTEELLRALDERDKMIAAMVRTRVWRAAQRWWSVKHAAGRLLKKA